MTPKQFEQAALALPGATVSVEYGDWRIYKVGGKAFAWMSAGEAPNASFKVDDLSFELLTRMKGIRPARYRARYNFVQLDRLDALPPAEIRARLAQSHQLIVEKLPKRAQPQAA